MNSSSELASTPAVALTAPIQGPSAAAVAAISTTTGNTTSPPSTNAITANSGARADCEYLEITDAT